MMLAPHAERASSKADGASPTMAQWFALKAEHQDALLFLRMGDFYELFFQDAEAAAAALDIALTRRGEHQGAPIPMCGVPVHAAEAYLARLIRRGFRVAVAEQMEDPKARSGKGPLKRAIVRLVTPGTLTEDSLLESHRPNLLLALAPLGGTVGAAWLDVSTGSFETAAVTAAELPALLGRLEPAEVIGPLSLPLGDWADRRGPETAAPAPLAARRRVAEAFGAADLDAFGTFTDAEAVAAALAIDYVRITAAGQMPRLSRPEPTGETGHMLLDAATRASLEITRARDGSATHTLLASIGRTLTAPGARLLASWLAAPLLDPARIAARQDGWGWLLLQPGALTWLRDALHGLPDLPRALGRVALGRAAPRDLGAVLHTLRTAERVDAALEGSPFAPAGADPLLLSLLARALADPLPARLEDGGVIASGFDGELDAHRSLRDDSRRVIAGLALDFAQRYGVAAIKIKHHAQLGYVIEAPASAAEVLRAHSDLTMRQSMTNAVRFSNAELAALDRRINEAAEAAAARERHVVQHLTAAILAVDQALLGAALRLARLDVLQSCARLAEGGRWCRPLVDESDAFCVVAARHPVVEAALGAGAAFVPNGCDLSPGRRCPAADRAEHGGQEHVPAAECAVGDPGAGRAAGAGGLGPYRGGRSPVQPGRRRRRPRARAQHVHGGDDRDGCDPEPGRATQPGRRRRDRPWHQHPRWARDRLGGAGGAAWPDTLPHHLRHALPRACQPRRRHAQALRAHDAGEGVAGQRRFPA